MVVSWLWCKIKLSALIRMSFWNLRMVKENLVTICMIKMVCSCTNVSITSKCSWANNDRLYILQVTREWTVRPTWTSVRRRRARVSTAASASTRSTTSPATAPAPVCYVLSSLFLIRCSLFNNSDFWLFVQLSCFGQVLWTSSSSIGA